MIEIDGNQCVYYILDVLSTISDNLNLLRLDGGY